MRLKRAATHLEGNRAGLCQRSLGAIFCLEGWAGWPYPCAVTRCSGVAGSCSCLFSPGSPALR